LNPSVRLDQIEIEGQSGLKTYDYVPITPESLDRAKGLDKGAGRADSSVKLSKGKTKHITQRHSYEKVKNEVDHLVNSGKRSVAEKSVEQRSFFNKNWSQNKIVKSVEQGANKLISKGKTNGTYTVKQYGEKVTIVIENGKVKTAYGSKKYTLKDFGY